MKLNFPSAAVSLMFEQDLIKQIAFHEAGHAAAIYLYNKQKQLPSVDFQITITKTDHSQDNLFASRTVTHAQFVSMVEGG